MISRPPAVSAVLVAALMALLCMVAWAQDAPKVTETSDIYLSLGAQHQSIDGNERYFDRYVTPPSGLFLSHGIWERMDYTGGPSFSLEAWDLGEPGPAASLWFNDFGLYLDAQYRRSTFFQDYDSASDRNRRRDYFLRLRPESEPGPTSFWAVRTRDVDMEGAPFSGPVDWSDRDNGASFSLKGGRTWFDFAFNREDFDVETGEQFSGNTQTYGLRLTPALDQKTQVSLSFARYITDLDNFGNGVRSWNADITAFYPVSETLDLTGQLRRFSIDQTITQNAYAHQQFTGRVEAEYRWRPGTTVTAFYQNGYTDYVDGRQANTVAVGSNTEGIRVRSRLNRDLKVKGEYCRYDTNNRPLSYTIANNFAPTLIYSTLQKLDLSATYAPAAVWGLTGDFERRTWDNDAQMLGNSLKTLTFTGWWQALKGALALTATFMRQEFHLPLNDVATQSNYDTRTTSWVLGANYCLNDLTSLYANYADADTYGASSNFVRHWTLGASRTIDRDDYILAELNFGNYTDDFTSDLNYDADLYRLEWQHKF